MQLQSFAVVEAAAALLTDVLRLRVNVLLRMLLNSDGFVLHGWTARRHHGDGLIALRLLWLLLNRLNGFILLVLLLHEVLLLLLHLLRMLLDLIFLDALVIACGRGGSVFDPYRRLDVVHDALMRRQLRLRPEALAAVQAGVRRVRVLPHVSHQRSLLQELLSAHRTLVRHASVQLSVVYQLELPREGRAAILADERIQTAVEARVHHQMRLLSKTESRNRVRDKVRPTSIHLPFSASFAHVRSFSSVELHVSHEVSLK